VANDFSALNIRTNLYWHKVQDQLLSYWITTLNIEWRWNS